MQERNIYIWEITYNVKHRYREGLGSAFGKGSVEIQTESRDIQVALDIARKYINRDGNEIVALHDCKLIFRGMVVLGGEEELRYVKQNPQLV